MSEHEHVRISWTALQRFEECPRQDKLHRDGLRQDIADKRNFLPGNIVDNAMRKWLEMDEPPAGGLVPLADEMLEKWTTNGEKIIWKGSEVSDRKRVLEDCRRALRTLEPWLTEHVLPYPYQPEARGYVEIQVPDQTGVLNRIELFYAMDILVQYAPDTFAIYDLKTTKNERYVYGKTLGQLVFYALGVSAAAEIPLRSITKTAFVTPLTRQLETVVVPDKDDYTKMLQRITAYAHAVWAGRHPTKEKKDSYCQYRCEVRNYCPMGAKPTVTDSGRVSILNMARMREGT